MSVTENRFLMLEARMGDLEDRVDQLDQVNENTICKLDKLDNALQEMQETKQRAEPGQQSRYVEPGVQAAEQPVYITLEQLLRQRHETAPEAYVVTEFLETALCCPGLLQRRGIDGTWRTYTDADHVLGQIHEEALCATPESYRLPLVNGGLPTLKTLPCPLFPEVPVGFELGPDCPKFDADDPMWERVCCADGATGSVIRGRRGANAHMAVALWNNFVRTKLGAEYPEEDA